MKKMIKWEPVNQIPNLLYIDKLEYSKEGLKIFLKEEPNNMTRRLKIRFKYFLGFRNFDETYRLKTISEDENFSMQTPWTLFVAEKDEFINWINVETYDMFEGVRSFKNYIIATPDDILEIITDSEPIAEWIKL